MDELKQAIELALKKREYLSITYGPREKDFQVLPLRLFPGFLRGFTEHGVFDFELCFITRMENQFFDDCEPFLNEASDFLIELYDDRISASDFMLKSSRPKLFGSGKAPDSENPQ